MIYRCTPIGVDRIWDIVKYLLPEIYILLGCTHLKVNPFGWPKKPGALVPAPVTVRSLIGDYECGIAL